MNYFITNQGKKNLQHRLIELIKASKELKFLVGFFYFSGIKELYEGLKENPDVILKVLVGLNVDKLNDIIIEFAEDNKGDDNSIISKFIEQVKKVLNSEEFDNKNFIEQVEYIINRLKDNKIIIRKTREPNHSKLYIFDLKEEQIARKNMFITGSSNLTKAGFTRNEFNIEISDYGVDEAINYYEELWNDSIKITEYEDKKNELIEVINNQTQLKQLTPFEAYCLVLKSYIESYKVKEIGDYIIKLLKDNGYTPYKYQIDAVSQALSILDEHNGVILADVVGLGKTIIACLIAVLLKKRGIVICPPGLIGDQNRTIGWKKYLGDFGLYKYDWEVRSLDPKKLEETLEFIKEHEDIEVIIVDEAHRFRNEDTYGYELLKNICRNKKVILLTATPFNNKPADILSLLKLFIIPKKSSITLSNNLESLFSFYRVLFDKLAYIARYYNSSNKEKKERIRKFYETIFNEKDINLKKVKQKTHYLAKQIRNTIEPITIRRNRKDLQKNPIYKEEVKNLSEVKDPPEEWFYELTKEQSVWYDRIINEYFGKYEDGGLFTGAIYRPFYYEAGGELSFNEDEEQDENKMEQNREFNQQNNLVDFMRSLLVKRFESSFGAFEQSIKNFKRKYEIVLEFITKTGNGDLYNGKYILDRDLIEKIYEYDLDEIEPYLLEYTEQLTRGRGFYPKKYKIYEVKKFKLKEKFINDIKADIKLFEKILKELNDLKLVENDPKLNCIIEKLRKLFKKEPEKDEPKMKVVIFSEFIDTVKYMQDKLNKNFKNRVLTVAGDLNASKTREIYENFDASYKEQKDNYDILLCTDKISEGYNLNRAGMVINYDIPWNPVRVIQRLGRINRIGKKVFKYLYIVNFFPTEQGAELVKSREIAQNKMFMIHKTLGEDAKIFSADEEPTPSELYNRINTNPENLETESFYTKVLNIYEDIKSKYPEIIEGLKNCPSRVKVIKKYDTNDFFVFFKKDKLYCVQYDYTEDKISEIDLEDIIEKIKCDINDNAIKIDDKFWEKYEKIKMEKDEIELPKSRLSLMKRAINKIDFLLREKINLINNYINFLKMLREDILDYGTLPEFTLRRIANLNLKDEKKVIDELKELQNILGKDYLEKEKNNIKQMKKEIIIAIENRKEKKGD